MIRILFKALRKALLGISLALSKVYTYFLFIANGVKFSTFSTTNYPFVMVARGGNFVIGDKLVIHNGIVGNPIGCYDRCTFFVDRGANLSIGDNVGISQSAIICHSKIVICNNVKIGGGVKIYDTDFHSLDPKVRVSNMDMHFKKKSPVVIKENVFIGAYSIILKGVTIGANSIIGAGSVVTKSIPDNQIWAGNPAKFIREI